MYRHPPIPSSYFLSLSKLSISSTNVLSLRNTSFFATKIVFPITSLTPHRSEESENTADKAATKVSFCIVFLATLSTKDVCGGTKSFP